jgi:hypothetical protein
LEQRSRAYLQVLLVAHNSPMKEQVREDRLQADEADHIIAVQSFCEPLEYELFVWFKV